MEPPGLPPLHAWCPVHPCMTPSSTSALLPLALTDSAHGVNVHGRLLTNRAPWLLQTEAITPADLKGQREREREPMSACYETRGSPPWLQTAFPSLLFYQRMNRCFATLSLKPFKDWAHPPLAWTSGKTSQGCHHWTGLSLLRNSAGAGAAALLGKRNLSEDGSLYPMSYAAGSQP